MKPNAKFYTELIFQEEAEQFKLNELVEYLKQIKGVYGYLIRQPLYLAEFGDPDEDVEKK